MVDWESPHRLLSVTHLDGRNAAKLTSLRNYFSEFAWMKMRLFVMARWAGAVAPILGKNVSASDVRALGAVADTFTISGAEKVVAIEKTLNHDLMALERYFVGHLPKSVSAKFAAVINLGLGSEDINNIALGLTLLQVRGEVILPELKKLTNVLADVAQKEKNTVLLARTHGVPAGLTTFGKELANPLLRLCDEVKVLRSLPFRVKLSGEVGTFHALSRLSTKTDWLKFTDGFIESLGLAAHHGSTQIVPYDSLVRFLHSLFRINTILLDLSQNMWLYVLLGYLRVQKKEDEVGSAGMPHKVNPIFFEGAEGGLVMANGIIETLARRLPVNRMQRDFSDSTLRRNLVLPIAYSLLSYQSIREAFARIAVDHNAASGDIEKHAEVWIEPIKAMLLTSGVTDAYERLKQHTRGRTFTAKELLAVIDALSLPPTVREEVYRLIVKGQPENPYPARVVAEAVAQVKEVF